MGIKRLHFEEMEQEQQTTKRVKIENGDSLGSQAVDTITVDIETPKDLRDLLSFQQDNSTSLRINLQRFRLFLYEIGNQLATRGASDKTSLLLSFLKTSTPREDDYDSDSLPDLIQAWSFASQANDYALLTIIPSILALLLRTISVSIDFRSVGNRLCKTILKKDNAALLDKGLSASTSKDQLIASCLRLLIELVSFDAGSSATSVYHQRDITFKRLDAFLGMRSSGSGTLGKGSNKSSPRSYAFEYILLSIVHHNVMAKVDLLSHPKLMRALLQDIAQDSQKLVSDFLNIVKTNILLDETFPTIVKYRLFTDVNLKQIASLFQVSEDLQLEENRRSSIPDAALDLLKVVCTSRQHGILFKQDGWYPSQTHDESSKRNMSMDCSFRSNNEQTGLYKNRVPVRNTTLASFLQDLRPWADAREQELALAIFQAAPELVADYFKRKQAFAFDPKLSMTWIGYSAFLFSVISLPLPALDMFDGSKARQPPPMNIVMESIMPAPLALKAVKKCLNHSSILVKFYATRILIASFRKLQDIISTLNSEDSPPQWKDFSSSIILELKQRVPDLHIITNAFRDCDKQQTILRDSLACLLSLYHGVAPEISDRDKLDISSYLTDMLHSRPSDSTNSEPLLPSLEMYNLLEMADVSFESRWWQKSEELPFSQFTSVLQMIARVNSEPPRKILRLLQNIVEEYNLLQSDQDIPSLSVLFQSCRQSIGDVPIEFLFGFLDNCILRFVQKPLKYCDLTEKRCESSHYEGPLSNLFVVIAEQWPFFCDTHSDDEVATLARWVSGYLRNAAAAGENMGALQAICHQIQTLTKCSGAVTVLQSALKDTQTSESPDTQLFSHADISPPATKQFSSINEVDLFNKTVTLHERNLEPPPEPKEYPCLSNWHRKDLADAIENFDIGNLFLYLSSEHEEIRLQAIKQLRSLMTNLKSSRYGSWEQLYLLVGIVVQTAEKLISTEPLVSFASVVAARFTLVLADPLHILYTKVNEFLNKSPTWNLDKLPSYWIAKIFFLPSDHAEAHHHEVEWLLEALLQGLRNLSDMDLYRRNSVFERLMSSAMSPRTSGTYFEKVVQVLYRCTLVGGSTTLVTRCGVMKWIQARRLSSDVFEELLLRTLDSKVREKCDTQRVSHWAGEDLAQRTSGADHHSEQSVSEYRTLES